jgi:hypothetical protein
MLTHSPSPLLFASDSDAAHKFSNMRASEGVEFDSLFNDGFTGWFNSRGGERDAGLAGCAVHLFNSCVIYLTS